MSEENYKFMKENQSFFKEAIDLIIKGNKTALIRLIEDYVNTHTQISTKDIIEEFQSEGRTLLHIAASQGTFIRLSMNILLTSLIYS